MDDCKWSQDLPPLAHCTNFTLFLRNSSQSDDSVTNKRRKKSSVGPHRLSPEPTIHSDLNSSGRSVTFTSLNQAGESAVITKQNHQRGGPNGSEEVNFSIGDFSERFPTFNRNLSDSLNSQRSDTTSTLNFNSSGNEGSLAALSNDWESAQITVPIDEGPLPSTGNARGRRETFISQNPLIFV